MISDVFIAAILMLWLHNFRKSIVWGSTGGLFYVCAMVWGSSSLTP